MSCGVGSSEYGVLQASINAMGASDHVQQALGQPAEVVRQMAEEANRWTAVEDELRALLNGVGGANLIRRQRLGLLAVHAYVISQQLARDPSNAGLLPHVQEIKRLRSFIRRKQSAPQTPQLPAPQHARPVLSRPRRTENKRGRDWHGASLPQAGPEGRTEISSRGMSALLRGLLLAAVVGVAGVAPAEMLVTASRVTLRAAPDEHAVAVATIPAKASLAVSSCSETWCAAAWNGSHGWVARRYLRATKETRRGYVNSDGKWVPSPQPSPGGPPAGASAQCQDGTYSFSTHRRGTCSHHGGVRRWL